MSETFFRILLSEIVMLRIGCKHCAAVIELPLQKLSRLHGEIECPGCHKLLQTDRQRANPGPDAEILTTLADAIIAVQAATNASVELSVPIAGPK